MYLKTHQFSTSAATRPLRISLPFTRVVTAWGAAAEMTNSEHPAETLALYQ